MSATTRIDTRARARRPRMPTNGVRFSRHILTRARDNVDDVDDDAPRDVPRDAPSARIFPRIDVFAHRISRHARVRV
jgi:hypothetical protein